MQKKYLVSMFMESPFYFDLTPRERLFLLQDHGRRFGRLGAFGPQEPAESAESPAPAMAAEPEQAGVPGFATPAAGRPGPSPMVIPYPYPLNRK